MNTPSKKGHRVAVVGGDGIGPEVVAEALKVIDAAGVKLDLTSFDLGGARYLRDGEVLSDATLDQLRQFDAILLGAVGTPDVPPGVIERGLLLKMREYFVGVSVHGYFTVAKNQQFVAHPQNRFFVGYYNGCVAVLLMLHQCVGQSGFTCFIKMSVGFVEQQQLWLFVQGPGKPYSLTHATR